MAPLDGNSGRIRGPKGAAFFSMRSSIEKITLNGEIIILVTSDIFLPTGKITFLDTYQKGFGHIMYIAINIQIATIGL